MSKTATVEELLEAADVPDLAQWIENHGVDRTSALDLASGVLRRVKEESEKGESFSLSIFLIGKPKPSPKLIPLVADVVFNEQNYLTSVSVRKVDAITTTTLNFSK